MSQTVARFFLHLTHWHWGLLAVGLTLMDLLLPRARLLWWGVAAGVVSALLFLFPGMDGLLGLFLFVAIALLAMGISRRPRSATPRPPLPHLHHHRASAFVGRMFTLTTPIRDGVGSLNIGGQLWSVRGLDMAAGTAVKVVGFEGIILSVEALEPDVRERAAQEGHPSSP
ncbi:MAG: NfeD family protein [Magnetococcales bacterium]|nr:NfeD family protein [Magnetococcales bacterium]